MYPDLSYIFHDLFGTEYDNWTQIFKTFGLFLVLAILSAAFVLYKDLKRKAEEGKMPYTISKSTIGAPPEARDLLLSTIIGFIVFYKLGYVLLDFEAFRIDPAASILSLKGNALTGVLGGLLHTAQRYFKQKKAQLPSPKTIETKIFPHDRIGEITMVAAISGIIGAKLFAALETPKEFLQDPLGMLLSGGGLAIYGGLIGGLIGISRYLKKHKISLLEFADSVVIALFLAYGVGRLGCHFSGDGDWGIVAASMPEWWFLPDWLWSYDYPHNVAKEGVLLENCQAIYCRVLPQGVYPTSIYEAVLAFGMSGFLWSRRKKMSVVGGLACLYLVMNGVERFFIEKIRVNATYDWPLGLKPTQAEIIAVVFVLSGIGLWLYLKQKSKQEK